MTAISITTAEDLAVREARSLPELIAKLQQVNPLLAASFAGKSLAASRSPWGTVLLPAITWAVAYYGLGWPVEVDTMIAGALVIVCSFAMRAITSSPITGWFHAKPMLIVTTPRVELPPLPIPPAPPTTPLAPSP